MRPSRYAQPAICRMNIWYVTIHSMNIASVDLNLLVALEALLEERHVTRAASRVGLSQPAMSAALRRLRDLFGDPLLLRTPDGMLPTARAAAVAPLLQQALNAVRSVLALPAPVSPQHLQRTFKVSTNDYLLWAIIPHVIALVRGSGPEISIQVEPSRSLRPWERLARGEVDVALDWFPQSGEPGREIHQAIVMRDDHVSVTRVRHPVIRRRLTLRQFARLPHVFVSMYDDPKAMGIVDPALFKLGLSRRIAVTTPHMMAVPALVSNSDLIATIPARLAQAARKSWPLAIWKPPLDLPESVIRMAWHERTHHDPAAKWFRDRILETQKRLV